MSQTQIASLFTPLIGRTVKHIVDGAEHKLKIARLSDKIGALKNGDKAEYVVLVRDNKEMTVVQLHPTIAKRLAEKGEAGEYVLVKRGRPVGSGAPKVEKVKVDKGPSKKERAIELVNAMRADGAERKDIIAKMTADFEMSEAAAATYYQAIKSGKWTAS